MQSLFATCWWGVFAGEKSPAPGKPPTAEEGLLAEHLPLRLPLVEGVAVNQNSPCRP